MPENRREPTADVISIGVQKDGQIVSAKLALAETPKTLVRLVLVEGRAERGAERRDGGDAAAGPQRGCTVENSVHDADDRGGRELGKKLVLWLQGPFRRSM